MTGCTYRTSFLLKCAKAFTCKWYTEDLGCKFMGEECKVSNCMVAGRCAAPNCLGVKWYYNLLMHWANMTTGRKQDVGANGGFGFPQNRTAIIKLLNITLREEEEACPKF